MYPELFRVPFLDYSVSSFGAMMAIAFLTGFWITSKRMEEEGLDPEVASTLLIYVMIGGVGGSKLYFAIDNWMRGVGDFSSLLFARAGITWYGGLVGGTLLGAVGARIHKLPVVTVMNCTAVAGAVGQSLGRVGCFLVGDDYGKVTDVPWAVTFPQGAPPTLDPVHPTQLYEVAWLLPVAGFLWWRRKRSPFLFGEYLMLNGAGRIVIENWRVNDAVLLGLTEPQLIGVAIIALGGGLWIHYFRAGRTGAAARAA